MGVAALAMIIVSVSVLPVTASVGRLLNAALGSAPATAGMPREDAYYGTAAVTPEMASMVPIQVRADPDDPWRSMVVLCRLDIAKRREDPSALPMFRFWVKASGCNSGVTDKTAVGFTKQMTMGELYAWLERTEEDWASKFAGSDGDTPEKERRSLWRPDGMVLHEARVGSTLVANMLQRLPDSVVYSESSPPADLLFRSPRWSDDARVQALRVVVRAMGRVAGARRLFFKFQSAVTGMSAVLHRAFPDTPFIFLKRDPVEVMASLLGNFDDALRRGTDTGRTASGRNTPCTRTIRAPPEGMAPALGFKNDAELRAMGTEAFCAAHIGFVEVKALATLTAATTEAKAGQGAGVGAAVDYKDLPAAVPGIVKDLFGVPVSAEDEAAMLETARAYSKGTNARSSTKTDSSGTFKPDSEQKRKVSPPSFKEAADRLVMPRRHLVDEYTLEAAVALRKGATPALPPPPTAEEWAKRAKELEAKQQQSSGAGEGGGAAGGQAGGDGSLVSLGKNDGTEAIQLDADAEASEPYPKLFPLPDMLDAWSADDPIVPSSYGQYASLRTFDFTKEEEVEEAQKYREAEVPFVARGVPNLLKINKDWDDDYLSKTISGKRHTEVSKTNHFMYYNRGAASVRRGNFEPVTSDTRKSYAAWIEHANKVERQVLDERADNKQQEHWYFRATGKHKRPGSMRGSGGQDGFVAEAFRIFDRTKPDNGTPEDIARSSFFIVDPKGQRGIHCRFGEAGIIAESHYDGGRNFITMVRGAKRYILSPPSECPNYNLLTEGPSARHSASNWGDPSDYHETLKHAMATEVVIEAGDALYVPSFWFHTPISLSTNIQCNTRSGSPPEGSKDIIDCGFRVQVTEGGSKRTTTPHTAAAPPPTKPTPAPEPAVGRRAVPLDETPSQ